MEMRVMMWIYALFILLTAEAWGTDTVVRNATFNLGSDANLTCSDKTWNETMYVIWKISLKNSKECRMSFSNDGQSEDLCNDSKSLRNSSKSRPYLHIPNFSNNDVGIYRCESAFKGGIENYEINVAITVRPTISAWLERENNKMVAVCTAERGKPAANISWSHTGNSPPVETLSESHGFFTAESRLELTEGVDVKNLSCAVSHPYWTEEQILVPEPQKGLPTLWLYIFTGVAFVVLLTVILLFALNKIKWRRCQQSNTPPSKSAPTENVEEVEPYASYVQRVNSIYNSSADLFT
ncbi:Cell surface glycoprotein CD200 receptor 1 [Larimichthys crocea]|uniref:Cell surface glycoprotein CD200 receptor 1 n=1 Tax=Larimichthys crocea TaxID=215358 RepID=A0A6G0J6P2_LARCR|nr:Cell surface glycoprotein CD200 receptor 1 [Larimichthys crocea]